MSSPSTAAEFTQAACRAPGVDPEWFFASPTDQVVNAHAKRICTYCPALRPCLMTALTTDVVGVWGGTTMEERSRLRRQFGVTAMHTTGWHALTWASEKQQSVDLPIPVGAHA